MGRSWQREGKLRGGWGLPGRRKAVRAGRHHQISRKSFTMSNDELDVLIVCLSERSSVKNSTIFNPLRA